MWLLLSTRVVITDELPLQQVQQGQQAVVPVVVVALETVDSESRVDAQSGETPLSRVVVDP